MTAFSAKRFLQEYIKLTKHKEHDPPDINVYLPAHGAGLDLEAAGVTRDVTIPALHDGRQRQPGAHRALQVGLEILRQQRDPTRGHEADTQAGLVTPGGHTDQARGQ